MIWFFVVVLVEVTAKMLISNLNVKQFRYRISSRMTIICKIIYCLSNVVSDVRLPNKGKL